MKREKQQQLKEEKEAEKLARSYAETARRATKTSKKKEMASNAGGSGSGSKIQRELSVDDDEEDSVTNSESESESDSQGSFASLEIEIRRLRRVFLDHLSVSQRICDRLSDLDQALLPTHGVKRPYDSDDNEDDSSDEEIHPSKRAKV